MLVGKRILVVEDEPLVAMDVAELLEGAGVEVLGPAHSLDEAMSLVGDDAMDGALLDIDLGNELVWPVAEALLARGTPFLFVSARCDRGERPYALLDVSCVPKPACHRVILEAAASL